MGSVIVAADSEPPVSPEAAQEAADIRSVRALPAGFARRAVPVRIPLHASSLAVVAVDHPSDGDPQLLGRLSVRLTVVQGDAIQVTGPRTVPSELVGGPLRWEWTLAGVHAGEAQVRTELFLDPPPGGAAAVAPVHYDTWEDRITVQPGVLDRLEAAATRGAGPWVLLGGATTVVLLAGLWLWRRQSDAA
jgi:hypothetical protein